MRRPQFSLKTLLWITLAVACFLGGWFGGRQYQERQDMARRIRAGEGIEVTVNGRRVFIPYAKQAPPYFAPGWGGPIRSTGTEDDNPGAVQN
jgi:hypothetical protein